MSHVFIAKFYMNAYAIDLKRPCIQYIKNISQLIKIIPMKAAVNDYIEL